MSYIVLDTDVASLSFKKQLPRALLARLAGRLPCITFATLGELTQWVELRHWGASRRALLTHWLDGTIVLPYDDDVARTWGRLSAAGIQRGRRPGHNDTWIAACALSYGVPLATLNVKDYADFAEYHGLNLVTS